MKPRAGDTFLRMYTEDWMSFSDIAEAYGCTKAYVHSALKEAGHLPLPRYPRFGYDNPELRKKENFIALLTRHSTVTEVAKKLNVTDAVIRSWCKFHELKAKDFLQPNRGAKRFNWKGGKFKDRKGYTRVLTNMIGYDVFNPDWKCHHTLEHKATMEMQSVGFPLPDDYVVHHINQDTADNRLENLAVLTRAQHIQIHSLLNKGDLLLAQITDVTRRLSSTNIESLKAKRRLQQLLEVYQDN